MNATQYLKEKKRMCDYANGLCGVGCPMYSCKGCGSIELIDPAEAVRIVEKWSKEHHIITNAMKFEEVFGWIPRSTDLFIGERQNHLPWWDEPYKEPERSDYHEV